MSTTESPRPSNAADGFRSVVVMGVCGSGKSVIGDLVASRLDFSFIEGDTLHPQPNIAKMTAGIPLTDEDRWPWLDAIAGELNRVPRGVVASCSALKRIYRDRLRANTGRPIFFLFLDGSRSLLAARMDQRNQHFMPAALLDSQLAILERPQIYEDAVAFDASRSPTDIAKAAAAALRPRFGERGACNEG